MQRQESSANDEILVYFSFTYTAPCSLRSACARFTARVFRPLVHSPFRRTPTETVFKPPARYSAGKKLTLTCAVKFYNGSTGHTRFWSSTKKYRQSLGGKSNKQLSSESFGLNWSNSSTPTVCRPDYSSNLTRGLTPRANPMTMRMHNPLCLVFTGLEFELMNWAIPQRLAEQAFCRCSSSSPSTEP
jgi:hypothetical protein